MSFKVVIPARLASTRLPGKVLADIGGRPMVQHVWERARESGAEAVIVATDSERIAEVCTGFGADVCMTSERHPSGTDRLAEVVAELGEPDERIVVNVQGDEPLMPPGLIRQVAANLEEHEAADIATLCEPIGSARELFNPNVVKVVADVEGYALYFSRAPIPWHRRDFGDGKQGLPIEPSYFRHLGIYAYRVAYLRFFAGHPPCLLEQVEGLEQLRAIYSGHRIHVQQAFSSPGPGVDTEADLVAVRRRLADA